MAVNVISTTKAPGAVGPYSQAIKVEAISSSHPVRLPSTRKKARSFPAVSSNRLNSA